jgi:predicted nucleic acid-binding protein
VNAYLDASVIVALFTTDPLSARADSYLRKSSVIPVVSDFAATEFASAVSRRVRMKLIDPTAAHTSFSAFDAWSLNSTTRLETAPVDIRLAESYLRRLDLNLRAPDAINIALAQRVGATLLTFDVKMGRAARAVGAPILVV